MSEQHDVGVDDVFFSTTDGRGRISQANSVFVRLSRYSREELIGAPHSINRNPLMPSGAFRIMWDTIQAGRPFGAYVMNRAKDGSRYDVFATITPLPDGGYLSVRTRPCVEATRDVVWQMYAATLATEQAHTDAGLPRHEVAEKGAEYLAGLVAGAGFASYDDFVLDALPAEVAAREALGRPINRPPRVSGPMRTVLDAVTEIWFGLEDHMDTLAALDRLSVDVDPGIAQLRATMTSARSTSEHITGLGDLGPGSGPLTMPLMLWASMEEEVDSVITPLAADLGRLRASARHTRLRIALARLHTTMVSTYANEVLDEGPDATNAPAAIASLCDALDDGLATLAQQSSLHRELVSESARLLDEAAGVVAIPLDLMDAWRSSAQGRELPERVRDLLPSIDDQLVSSRASVERLGSLADACREAAVSEDTEDLRSRVAAMREAAAEL